MQGMRGGDGAGAEQSGRFSLPLLALALVQGLLLYGLHQAGKHHDWPATQPALLHAVYAVVLWIPVTVQLLARHVRCTTMWKALAVMAVALALFGWHFGALVLGRDDPKPRYWSPEIYFGAALAVTVLWLVVVAFLRARLETDEWKPPYEALFAAAWRNKLTLAEAGLFVGLFWILLATCGALFHTLGIEFFRELFRKPAFYYPVTALAAGSALQLVGGIDRLVDVVLRQLLGLLKWLAPVAGVIVVLFTLALLPKLPGLIGFGVRALSAAWLLWLVALTVLLINAAYQDGRQVPYGALLSMAMRVVPPLLLIVAAMALYAVFVRVHSYGMTAGRYWALVTAGMAVLHAGCYAWTALRGRPWMAGIGRSNPWMALVLAVVLVLSLTPPLSPQRLSAASQERVIRSSSNKEHETSALEYLRFRSGEYGVRRLRALAKDGDVQLATVASAALKVTAPYDFSITPPRSPEQWLEQVQLYPVGKDLPQALRDSLLLLGTQEKLVERRGEWRGLWVNLAGDDRPELLLTQGGYWYWMLAETPEGWRKVSSGQLSAVGGSQPAWNRALEEGDIGTVPAEYSDVRVGSARLHLLPSEAK